MKVLINQGSKTVLKQVTCQYKIERLLREQLS